MSDDKDKKEKISRDKMLERLREDLKKSVSGLEDELLEELSEATEEDIDKVDTELIKELFGSDTAEEDGTLVLPMIPLRGLTIFPTMVLHIDIGREKSINALEKAMIHNQKIFLATQKDESTDLPTVDEFYKVGTIAKVKQMLKMPGDNIRVLVEGISRGEISEIVLEVPYFKCKVKQVEEIPYDQSSTENKARMRSVLASFEKYLQSNPKSTKEIFSGIASIASPGRLADIVTSHLDIKIDQKQKILECYDVKERLTLVGEILAVETEILTMEQDISTKLKSAINKNQKEYYLREQLRVIQDELGQTEAVEDEVATWSEQLKELGLSEKITDKVEKEIKRYSRLAPSSAESGIIRTYIETVLALPWNKLSKVNVDLKKAEKILNAEHYGLEKVKERVLEYLAVIHLSKEIKGPILCLVGPPGVGKTSIAKSVANATNREFVRMSLGGVRDEAEIRGHRRTYIGAIPGRVIAAIKEAGTRNPVFLFDEVDKIGADFKGDPASALLEVLDPEQNKEFMDHYMETPFDLSKVIFITTANSTSTIPRPLLDRMEVIQVPGYTEEEKVKIAEKYLIPKKIKEHGLETKNLSIATSGVRHLINYYTRESGVRNLEREVANICRKVAKKIVTTKEDNYKVNSRNMESYLGKKKYRFDIIEGENEVGVVTGMAWTSVGGDTLFIETTAVAGTGKLVLTGKLGDVMQESAKAAVSYTRSVAEKLDIQEDFYKTLDLHIHVPEGATPKDGPSAGIAMCTAIISTLTNRPVKKEFAMTGEITLRGKVLPIGGVREKVLAAHRAGITKIILPIDNERDVDDIPANVRKNLKFIFAETMDQVLENILEAKPKE